MDRLYDPAVIKNLFSTHGFTFSKRLGQNFLINPSVCPKIAEYGCEKGCGVLEIGPGIGVLTNELSKRASKVVAVELDSRLLPILAETLSDRHNVKIINADILQLDLRKLISEEFPGLKVSVCANLPYYITSPTIMKLLESRLNIESITTMVQREAADRLCAPLGSREAGAVTVAVDYFSEAKYLFSVSRWSFMPTPQVDSAVIRLDIRKTPPAVSDEELFFKIIRGIFTQRRKTILNGLSGSMGIEKALASKIIASAGINAGARPEQLKMCELISLSESYKSEVEK